MYSDEWNRVVDGLDILYGYVAGMHARLDCLEEKVDRYYLEVKEELGAIESKVDRYYGYLSDALGAVEEKIDQYYLEIKQELAPPQHLDTYTVQVGATPVPLSDVDRVVKKIHVKLPSWVLYLCYIGDETKQEFVVEPGDEECLKIPNPRQVYIRSLGNVTVYVMLEF